MAKIRMYRVQLDYIKYLWEYIDKKVQYRKGASDEYNIMRPYVGVVYELGDYKYFAPLEHPRLEHQRLKANPHIVKIDGGVLGIIAIGNMIPVTDEILIKFDINAESGWYRKILIRQYIFCKNNIVNICENATKTYENVVNKKIEFFVKNCCDFKSLEIGLKEYLTVYRTR